MKVTDIAATALDDAKQVVTTERGNQHGGAEDSFETIANLWQDYLTATNRMHFQARIVDVVITPKDVAQMMVMLKIARQVHGDPNNPDHFIDQLGYSSLAAGLHFIDAAKEHARRSEYKEDDTPVPATGKPELPAFEQRVEPTATGDDVLNNTLAILNRLKGN